MSGEPTLRKGSAGPFVVLLQGRLAAHGFDPGPADGDFGDATLAAVVAFQGSQHLVADGIVGNQTWAALNNEPAQPPGVSTGTAAPPTPSPSIGPSVEPPVSAGLPGVHVVLSDGPYIFDGGRVQYSARNVGNTATTDVSVFDVVVITNASNEEVFEHIFQRTEAEPLGVGEPYTNELQLPAIFQPGDYTLFVTVDAERDKTHGYVEFTVEGEDPPPPPPGGSDGPVAFIVFETQPDQLLEYNGRNAGDATAPIDSVVDLLTITDAQGVPVHQDTFVLQQQLLPDAMYFNRFPMPGLQQGEYTAMVTIDIRGSSITSEPVSLHVGFSPPPLTPGPSSVMIDGDFGVDTSTGAAPCTVSNVGQGSVIADGIRAVLSVTTSDGEAAFSDSKTNHVQVDPGGGFTFPFVVPVEQFEPGPYRAQVNTHVDGQVTDGRTTEFFIEERRTPSGYPSEAPSVPVDENFFDE